MLYIRHFYRRPQRAAMFSLLILLLGAMLLGNFYNWTAVLRTSSAAPVCVAPPPGMRAWYPGENNADDIQGPTFENGTLLNGATATTPGEVGNAFSFDGTDDFVNVPNSPALEPTSAITVDMWVKSSTPGSTAYLVAKGAQSCSFASYSINAAGAGGGLAFDLFTSVSGFKRSPFSTLAGINVFDGGWHHIAGTYDGSVIRLYVDGIQAGSGTAATGTIVYSLVPNNNLTIGRFDGICTLSYAGLLDEIEIFDRALSLAEVQGIFNAGTAGKCKCVPPPSGLKAWYQGEGNANDIQGPIFSNGVLNGATAASPGKVGTAFSFNGTTDYVNVPNTSELEPAAGITVDLWVKSLTPGADAYLVSKGADSCSFASYSINNSTAGNGLAFDVVTSGSGFKRSPFSILTGINVFDGNWHHIAGTYDGFFVRLFVDGVQAGTGTAATGTLVYSLATTNDLSLGRFNNASCPLSYGGLLDEIEIFDRALTPTEVQSLFNAGSIGKCAPPAPSADLSIAKTHVSAGTPGAAITYTITVLNNGPANVTGALVNDAFPANVTGVNWTCAASIGASCGLPTFGSGNIINKPVDLNAGSSVVFTATGTISPGAVVGSTISNTATVSPSDSNPGNNSSTDSFVVVSPGGPNGELSITKTHATLSLAGSPVTYTITIFNNGPANVTGAVVTDVFPALVTGITWVCSPSIGATCLPNGSGPILNEPVNLNAGSFVVYTVFGTISNAAPPGSTISNTATVSSASDTTPGDNTSTTSFVVGTSNGIDLTVTPTFCGSLVRGKTGAMLLRITNKGSLTATGVMTSTALTGGVDICATSVSGGGSCTTAVNFLGQTIVQCNLLTIPSGGVKNVQINIRPRCSASNLLTTMNSVFGTEFELVPRDNRLGTSTAITGSSSSGFCNIFGIPNPCTTPSSICPP